MRDHGRAFILASCLLAAFASAGAGCSDVPPPPDWKTPAGESSQAPYSVTLILRPESTRENEAVGLSVRRDAARQAALFALERPGPGDPPARQAEIIRKAAARPRPVLIVEPADDPEVARAVAEVRAAGTPVVTVGRRLPGPGSPAPGAAPPAPPAPAVVFAPVGASARRLVELVLGDERREPLPAGCRALVVAKDARSSGVDEAIAAFREELASKKVDGAATAVVVGDLKADGALVAERLRADPALGAVFAFEVDAVNAVMAAVDVLKYERVVRAGGLMSVDVEIPPPITVNFCGLIDRNATALAVQAFERAIDLADGVPVAEVVEVPLRLEPRPEGVHPDRTELLPPPAFTRKPPGAPAPPGAPTPTSGPTPP